MSMLQMLLHRINCSLLVCFALVTTFGLLILVDSSVASTPSKSKAVWLVTATADHHPSLGITLQSPGGATVPEEDPFYTNPFYIFGAVLVLALGVEIYLLKRKRDRERQEKGQSKQITQSQKEQPELKRKKKSRYGKEQMSELLKASASPSKKTRAESTDEEITKTSPLSQDNNQTGPVQQERLDEGKVEALHSLSEEDVAAPKTSPTKEPLPPTVEDSMLYDALLDIKDEAASIRAVAVRDLAQFKTQNSVDALTRAVLNDNEESVRLEAVKSLKTIGHDTAFTPLFIALSDESQQVRAAAAEALKGWPSERAGNYLQLIESGDERMIERAAQACIETSLFKQALSHLNSQNQKHSNEAFAMLSVLAKAGMNEPLLEALEEHYDSKARLLLIRLLNESGRPESQEQLRALASREDLPEDVRAEIMQSVGS